MSEESFVKAVYQSKDDKGLCSALKRADSSNLNFRCCEFLIKQGINIENEQERLTASVIAASIARSKSTEDGAFCLPRALALCYMDNDENSAAKIKMRKLCSCNSVQDLVKVLGPILKLINSRNVELNHTELYKDIRSFKFDNSRERTKTHWMRQFFSENRNE